jgi:hypothetical protein
MPKTSKPSELARAIASATPKPPRAPCPKPPAKRRTLTQRADAIEDVLIDQGYLIDGHEARLDGLVEVLRRTENAIALLEHRQTDHASSMELEALRARLALVTDELAIVKRALGNNSPGTWALACIGVSFLLTVMVFALAVPRPKALGPRSLVPISQVKV